MHQKDASDTEQSNVPFKQPVESIKPLINAHPRTHEQLSIPPKPARTIHSSRHIHIAPGYSTLDWEQLKRTSSSFPKAKKSLLYITLAELQLHNQINDAWIALNGKVYDITLYIPYHPGGEEIMKAVGKDGTKLLIHPWVNYECLLDKCWIGLLTYR
ncbi:unnamed protein product [Pneumocystis jirovecii]|uniref:Cytochrome b5 heme-binding domain-containing protein n=1 Tax=Pneumocystis jirovecii TaxID=42068 RepID=L0PCB1_PNEJI|nr:unnamed protein product [Pneumocystis jirovecii]